MIDVRSRTLLKLAPVPGIPDRAERDHSGLARRMAELLARFRPAGSYRERFIVQTGQRVVLVNAGIVGLWDCGIID